MEIIFAIFLLQINIDGNYEKFALICSHHYTSSWSEKLIKNYSTLHIVSIGNPQPKYRWFKDWEPLSDMATSGSFRIQDTRRKDTGIYHCVATNDVGSIFSNRVGFSVACKHLRIIDLTCANYD